MDTFERHFSMLRKAQSVFDKNKQIDIGIKIDEKLQKGYLSTGRELLPLELSDYFLQVRSIYYHNVVMKRLEEFDFPEWLICLNEKVLLEYAIPLFSRVVKNYPMLSGINGEWQVLFEITKIEFEFWDKHEDWKKFYQDIIREKIMNPKEIMIQEAIPQAYFEQLKYYLSL